MCKQSVMFLKEIVSLIVTKKENNTRNEFDTRVLKSIIFQRQHQKRGGKKFAKLYSTIFQVC